MTNPCAYDRIIHARERGNYPRAAAIGTQAFANNHQDLVLILHAMRAAMAAGDLNAAAIWFERGNNTNSLPGISAMLELEGAHLGVLSQMDIRSATKVADAVGCRMCNLALAPGDTAELDWLRLRVAGTAAIYREIPPKQGTRIDAELAQTIKALFAAGRTYFALNASYTLAERRTPAAASPGGCPRAAFGSRWPHIVGWAERSEAQQSMSYGASSVGLRASAQPTASSRTAS